MQEEIELARADLKRYQDVIAELTSINKNMVTTFETLNQEKMSYLEEFKNLKYEYFFLKQNHEKTQSLGKIYNKPQQPKLMYNHRDTNTGTTESNTKKSKGEDPSPEAFS
ncbi:hypothetical protein JTB14_012809 [Gonioctena quinquepunctata]|nr:hypothetical protein JTB14_012809 [Gonioctena quinquepunctata]